jgi:cell wall-associated NlpC family hydrolase
MAWAHAGVQLLHYTGNGMMVNAPYTGAFVRIDSIYAPGGPYLCRPPGGLTWVSGSFPPNWPSTWP